MAAAPVVPVGSAEGPWTDDKERTLIAFFYQNSCLWNHRSENYKNRHLRWKTLERLRQLLSATPPAVPFTVDDIKNKFKNLRTTFQRQVKQVTASRASGGDVFQPQWKHYQQLMFLLQDDDEPPPSPQTRPQEEEAPPTSPGIVPSFLHTTSASLPGSAPCDTFNVAVKCYWTEERERQLISFYADHRCLWNKRCENHNNRLLRMKLLETLRQQLSDQSVSFSVDDIKSKFKNLRTVFNRELKSVQFGRASDRPYVSKWKHYQQLMFLCESCDEDDASDEKDADPSPASTYCSSTYVNSSASNGSTSGADATAVSAAAVSPYHVFISASPDQLKTETGPASPPEDPPTNPAPLSTESRCYWTEDKVEQLIRFYSEHGCLWNLRSERYSNRLLRRSLLETLSALLSENQPVPFTVDDIKTKFRNLRTIFRREHRAASSNKTCGSEDFYLPRWRHYRDLMFLCDSCDEDEQHEQLRLLCPDSRAPQSGAFAAPPSATPPRLPALLPVLVAFRLLVRRRQSVGAKEAVSASSAHRRRGTGTDKDVVSESDAVAARRLPEVRGGVSERDAAGQSQKTEEEDHRDHSLRDDVKAWYRRRPPGAALRQTCPFNPVCELSSTFCFLLNVCLWFLPGI
ncbi:uncharacterized protein LOC115415805 isoform X2 [Sphaeramia orbicularis]|uniref:uncharacterized protein LOC115415805 isoform X2 n=1 Tax=Sphaeramia orbicularis TaxID=375764 RepID=UPI00117E03D4|nr:uncharacterized protein LOC115415805 isoform X2 [Sphaeramia orbicularis]